MDSRPLHRRPRSTSPHSCRSNDTPAGTEGRKESTWSPTTRISAVLVSTDLERSQRFYETKVGLTVSPETIRNHLLFGCGDGTTLLIHGRPGANKADHTQVRFWSTDIETFKTIVHIVTSPGIGRSAWFKDPDENTIAVFQPE